MFPPRRIVCLTEKTAIPAVRSGFLREIKSPLILQPGPAALTEGLDVCMRIVDKWSIAQRTAGIRANASAR